MIFLLSFILSALSFALYFKCGDLARERKARRAAEEAHASLLDHSHGITTSALRGNPLVKCAHPSPQPASDHWYWRARFEGLEYLFTEESLRTARNRAELLLRK
jgi:hypothetical protein